jgi:hypothetical protein
LAGAFLAAFLTTFLPGTPRTLCVFLLVTNFATHGLDCEPARPCAKSALKRPSPREHAGRSASHESG